MSTPWRSSVAQNAGASATQKTTMFVSTAAGSSVDAGELREPLGQRAGVRVVLGQPVDVMVERVERAGGDDPRLAHRAAEHLLVAPRLVDQLARAGEAGADRRARGPS